MVSGGQTLCKHASSTLFPYLPVALLQKVWDKNLDTKVVNRRPPRTPRAKNQNKDTLYTGFGAEKLRRGKVFDNFFVVQVCVGICVSKICLAKPVLNMLFGFGWCKALVQKLVLDMPLEFRLCKILVHKLA